MAGGHYLATQSTCNRGLRFQENSVVVRFMGSWHRHQAALEVRASGVYITVSIFHHCYTPQKHTDTSNVGIYTDSTLTVASLPMH